MFENLRTWVEFGDCKLLALGNLVGQFPWEALMSLSVFLLKRVIFPSEGTGYLPWRVCVPACVCFCVCINFLC